MGDRSGELQVLADWASVVSIVCFLFRGVVKFLAIFIVPTVTLLFNGLLGFIKDVPPPPPLIDLCGFINKPEPEFLHPYFEFSIVG